ncbi:thiol-disulfide oxidoreductase DCC family protein [Streptomyces sp. NPDC051684]|uniref:thiol-disulfide oxidoreductase DCC family protein n=1 Tax=Streptomyces sp. NPDC051684 TaxID=3365670 RepID=UPI003794CABD
MTAVGTDLADRGATGVVPVRRLTVLYDADCALCTHVRNWLVKQRQLVPLDLVPAGHARARALFPGLDHSATLREITVIGDGGQIYRGAAAWVVCMWALREYRATSHRMATPMGLRFAKHAVLGAAKYRELQQQRQDGWTYDPQRGWFHAPPACDSGCRTAD